MAKTVRSCEVMSRLEDDSGNALISEETIHSVCSKECIENYAYIVHNKDVYTKEDEEEKPEHKVDTLKPAHIHLLLKFKRNQPQRFDSISKWFNIPNNFVSTIRSNWENAVLYLTHKNAPEKFQYSTDEVVANFDIDNFIANAIKSQSEQKLLDEILVKIISGEINEYNRTQEIDKLFLVKHLARINDAFKVRAENLQATQKERNTTVIYICGQSGCGKTTLAKKIANDKGLDYFISSGSNDIMDGYAGQPCLIIDDVRPSSLGLSDLLKMLDNHTASSVKSRYKNKYLNCEFIILTSVLDIDDFYHNVFENECEPITQLKRRCGIYIKMDKYYINTSVWNDIQMNYSEPVSYPNYVYAEIEAQKLVSEANAKSKIEEVLPFLADKSLEKSMEIENEPIKETTEEISDENFFKLFPINKGDYYAD